MAVDVRPEEQIVFEQESSEATFSQSGSEQKLRRVWSLSKCAVFEALLKPYFAYFLIRSLMSQCQKLCRGKQMGQNQLISIIIKYNGMSYQVVVFTGIKTYIIIYVYIFVNYLFM